MLRTWRDFWARIQGSSGLITRSTRGLDARTLVLAAIIVMLNRGQSGLVWSVGEVIRVGVHRQLIGKHHSHGTNARCRRSESQISAHAFFARRLLMFLTIKCPTSGEPICSL